jgi:hypothetical protein
MALDGPPVALAPPFGAGTAGRAAGGPIGGPEIVAHDQGDSTEDLSRLGGRLGSGNVAPLPGSQHLLREYLELSTELLVQGSRSIVLRRADADEDTLAPKLGGHEYDGEHLEVPEHVGRRQYSYEIAVSDQAANATPAGAPRTTAASGPQNLAAASRGERR